MMDKATVLGLMSGSSLDGLDACVASFHFFDGKWQFDIKKSDTFPLPDQLKEELREAPSLKSDELLALDVKYGKWMAGVVKGLSEECDLIGLHGHTVYHAPERGFSLQIGNGEVLQALTGKPVVAQFRNADILQGGQGAPLVPMGERLLFPEYDAFLNLGGICNLTVRKGDRWLAGDIGPCNQVPNFYAQMIGLAMDKDGELARSGRVIDELYKRWAALSFFLRPFPKSLANQWVQEHFLNEPGEVADVLATFQAFITDQIASAFHPHAPAKVLVTGGGARNTLFIETLGGKVGAELVVPEQQIVDMKEALIFGLLALLRVRGEANVMSSCTGAREDTCGGVLYGA